jgi:hypothetical protein
MVIAFCATEGGNAGPNAAVVRGGAPPGPAVPGDPAGAGGVKVFLSPAGLVIVTIFVVLLISTLLWMLAKITLFGGGGAT